MPRFLLSEFSGHASVRRRVVTSVDAAAAFASLDPAEVLWALDEFGVCDADQVTIEPWPDSPAPVRAFAMWVLGQSCVSRFSRLVWSSLSPWAMGYLARHPL